MPFSVNIKTDVVDFDAGTNISADTVDELKQNLTDFMQSGVVDYINRAALAARERGHAAKRGEAAPAPVVTEAQAVQNVQQAFPEAQVVQEAPAYVAPAPPVPTPSLPDGVEFQQRADGKLNVITPFLQDKSKWAAVNDALKTVGARGEKLPDGTWAKYKTITPDKQEAVARALSFVLG